jgi:hypothetical protein
VDTVPVMGFSALSAADPRDLRETPARNHSERQAARTTHPPRNRCRIPFRGRARRRRPLTLTCPNTSQRREPTLRKTQARVRVEDDRREDDKMPEGRGPARTRTRHEAERSAGSPRRAYRWRQATCETSGRGYDHAKLCGIESSGESMPANAGFGWSVFNVDSTVCLRSRDGSLIFSCQGTVGLPEVVIFALESRSVFQDERCDEFEVWYVALRRVHVY